MSGSDKTSSKMKKRRRRRRRHPLLRLLILAAIIAGAVFFLKSELFNITAIEIEGNRYYTLSQIQSLSEIETGQNIFFDVKVKAARSRLLEDPYIKNANVSRRLPSTIVITIEERAEFAAVQTSGGFMIIDDEGMVLRVSQSDPELTLIEGIELIDSEVGKPLNVKQSYLLNSTLDLIRNIGKNDLFFRRIYFSSAVVRAYIYDDYYCEGTPENISENLPAIKELISMHYQQGIDKGVIKVGTGGYLSFNPKID